MFLNLYPFLSSFLFFLVFSFCFCNPKFVFVFLFFFKRFIQIRGLVCRSGIEKHDL